jgi:hypothetical protein
MKRVRISLKSKFVALVSASAAVVLLATSSAKAQEPKETGDKKTLNYVGRTADFGVGLPKCQGLVCVVPFNDFAIADGDLSGSSIGAGAFVQLGTRGFAVRMGYFTGTLSGCPGGGSFIGVTVTRTDSTKGNSGTINILEGSGAGGLSGVRGSFTFTADPAPGSPVIAKGTGDCKG